jgi:death on curing protein
MPELFIILVTVRDAIQLHEMIIARFGGSSGIRDLKLLESALDQPLKAIEYGSDSERSIEYLAASYFFHIIKHHAFVDGNKRTGLLVATTFLARNKFALEMDFDELYGLTLKTAESKVNKQEISLLFKACIRQVTSDEFL